MSSDKLYLMYLRKSRADADYSDEQTLMRHKARLDELCKSLHIVCHRVIEEVGTADSIAGRPGMMELLNLVETGQYEGVVCIDMDRLSRGDGADQALVINTFKYSDTKIITPLKIYDFAMETDEQFAELGLFIAKQEYRQIKKRLYQGRIDSTKEGKYSASLAPFGYEKIKLKGQKGHSLRVIPREAEIIRTMFELFNNGCGGCAAVGKRMAEMGLYTRSGRMWTKNQVYNALTNPVYIGKTMMSRNHTVINMEDGRLSKHYVKNPSPVIADGLHEAIVSLDAFDTAAQILKNNFTAKTNVEKNPVNPLSGILVCSLCGKGFRISSASIKTGRPFLYCKTSGCKCHGSYLDLVEGTMMGAIERWLENYELVDTKANDNKAAALSEKIKGIKKKIDRCYDAYENGVYELSDFRIRLTKLKDELHEAEEALAPLNVQKADMRPQIKSVIEKYAAADVQGKNAMLHSILEKVEYKKESRGPAHADEFELILYPKLPS